MPIQYYCSTCGTKLSISRKKIGEWVPCPSCTQVTQIPEQDQLERPKPRQKVIFAEAVERAPLESDEVTAEKAADEKSLSFWDSMIDEEPATEPAPLQFRRRMDDQEEMDLTPMVDVTFLLLIFFMITASFSLEKTIPTPVPDPNEQSASQPIQQQEDLLEKSIQIEILGDNTIALDEEPLGDPTLLRDRLTDLMQRDQKAEALVMVADAALQETVVYVLDTANAVGMQRIRLATGENE